MAVSSLATRLDALPARPSDASEPARFSLVTASPVSVGDLEAKLASALPSSLSARVEPAFRGGLAGGDGARFHFLVLPSKSANGAPAEAFEASHALVDALGLQSSRPIFNESLYGSYARAADAPAREFDLRIPFISCDVDQIEPAEMGWAPTGVGAVDAWGYSRAAGRPSKGEGAVIALIDTGSSHHVEVDDVYDAARQANFVEGGPDASDRFSTDVLIPNPGHGTLGASVMASRGALDEKGATGAPGRVTGVAPAARIAPVRALRSVVDLNQSRIPAAIEHAIDSGCDVISMSLGGPGPVEAVEYALQRAVEAGLVVVAAAGNCWGPVVYPAAFSAYGLVAAIAALDYSYAAWPKTSRGPQVTISAFGEGVYGAHMASAAADPADVRPSQGTTLATALTAGAAALWAAHHGRDEIRAAAAAAGLTVQRLFMTCLAESAYRPPLWNSQDPDNEGQLVGDGLGAGALNAGRLLAHPLTGLAAAGSADRSGPRDAPRPLAPLLAQSLALHHPQAALEVGPDLEPHIPELLFNYYRASARERQVQHLSQALDRMSLALTPCAAPSDLSSSLKMKLAARPALAEVVG